MSESPGPLVVFEAGMGAPASSATHIPREIGADARTLSYDRATIGSGDRGPRSLERIVDDLAEVIDAVDDSSPLVLVGHSWGGPIICLFAHLNPERVVGMVLVSRDQ